MNFHAKIAGVPEWQGAIRLKAVSHIEKAAALCQPADRYMGLRNHITIQKRKKLIGLVLSYKESVDMSGWRL